MNEPSSRRAASLVLRVLGRLARPIRDLQADAERLRGEQAVLAAQVEQLVRANDRLAAYQDRFVEELTVRYEELARAADSFRSVALTLDVEGQPSELGPAILESLERAAQQAAAAARSDVVELRRSVAELRVADRLTQVMLDRLVAGSDPDGTGDPSGTGDPVGTVAVDGVPVPAVPSGRRFRHAAPDLDLLYRAFEDRNRGSTEEIRARQREDYLKLVLSTPADLPVVDLGCGRGELVELLTDEGVDAIGVDANGGQLLDGGRGTYVEADLFDWLDGREDASCRAVVSLHVVEHLPVDLQVRLAFEARRVLAPGGVLILETPNTQSVSVGGSRFWVDPTHERPVHPVFLAFLLTEAGFAETETRFLHPVPLHFTGPPGTEGLVDDLNTLLLGPGDVAVVGRR